MTYRIVDTDNFGGDYPNEKFVGEEYASHEEAQAKANRLNGPDGRYSSRYYTVVELPYELQPGFEP